MDNYYEILHIANFAEIEIVKAAYKAMTKLYHPDINHQVDSSVMVKINLAYEILGNQESKSEYDQKFRQYINSLKSEKKSDYKDSPKYYREAKPKREPRNRAEKAAYSVGGVLWAAADGFMEGIREFQEDIEKAYLKGCDYNDLTLIKQYLRSTGAKKQGYLKVLIERGLLSRENGELVPSYEFKQIARYL